MALNIIAPFIALVGVALSAPIYSVPLTYVALSPIPENIYNQVQDTKSGEYAFGYAGGPVAREEAKTSDGVVRGAYSYVDAHGIVQYYRYIADDDGFRVIGTNIPTEATSSVQTQLQEQLKINAENSPDESEEHSSRRKKRSVLYHTLESVEGIPVAPLTVVAGASVPTATSSQSRVQVHNNFKAEVKYPVEAIASEPIAIAPEVAVKSADAIPIAVAASVPTSTSSQFRHQIHNSVRTEIHAPAELIPTKTVAAVPAASVAVPIQLKTVAAIPVAVAAASVPISTSSQSRYQVHNSGKTELHASGDAAPSKPIATASAASTELESAGAKTIPDTVATPEPISTSSQSHLQGPNSVKTEVHEAVGSIPTQTVAAAPAPPLAVSSAPKTAEALPIPVAATLPTSTSSQSRFQVHSSARTEIHKPLDAIYIQTVAGVPATLISAADSVLVATSTQRRFQSHESSEALSASATATKSDQVHSQGNSKVGPGYGDLSQSSKSKFIDQEPVNGLRLTNAFSIPSLARHPIGVGLGVLPSPLVAYAFETPLYA